MGQNTCKGATKGIGCQILLQKIIDLFFWSFETMVIMAHYSFLTHMNVKKLKLKIHLIQF
jgi:hypothetical protein